MRESLFVVGLFAAGLVIGYLVGTQREVASVQAPTLPSNYDSARAVVSDALKAQTEATERCWQTVVKSLAETSEKAEKAVAIERVKVAAATQCPEVKKKITH